MPTAADRNSTSSLNAWRRALEITAPIAQNPSVTLPAIIDNLADRFETAPALLSVGESLSFRALAERANSYGRWALSQGLDKGDVVCLLLPNCPDYMAIWLGVTRVGGIVALINTNLVGAALAHSISLVAPTHVIVGAGLLDTFAATLPRLDPGIRCWAHGAGNDTLPRIDDEIRNLSAKELDRSEIRAPSISDRALYIYTSGTTGLPKAAAVSHFRLMQWSHWFAGMMDTRPSDRMYNCLPMYHSIGGVVALGATLVGGGSVVIRDRFSASDFWDDIAAWDCTLFQYIGELCRYLVTSPPHPQEAGHRLRLCCGNGLRSGVWEAFQSRFHIPQILEFYAATEGNFSLYNCDGKPGAIGRIPAFLAHRFPVALVRFNGDTDEPLRTEEGFCVRCAADEAGEAIGKIADGTRFEGYSDRQESDRKILRNVFATGDAWYRTGDLMRRDRSGYYYFVDRIGDTFRWKGENVSTLEVEGVVAACPGVIEAVVYGVKVPSAEGRAGMAAVVVDKDFDLSNLRWHIAERLPEYARPVFLRLRGEIELTGTFKPQKQRLASEAYDPTATADVIYIYDRVREAFVILDDALYRRVQSGESRL